MKPEPTPANKVVVGYAANALHYAPKFDFAKSDLRRSAAATPGLRKTGRVKSAVWFIPPVRNPASAKFNLLFRFAEYLTGKHAIRNAFAVLGGDEVAFDPARITEAYPALKGSKFFHVNLDDGAPTHLPPFDLGFCSTWQTAYPLLKFNRVNKKIYMMLDYEPYDYPAGSLSALAEATYRFGFPAICASRVMRDSYEEFGGTAMHLEPALDHSLFHPGTASARRSGDPPYRIVLIGHPSRAGTAFETAAEALKKVKKYFGPQVEIYCTGDGWDGADDRLEGIGQPAGRLTDAERADLFRSCDAGLCLSLGRRLPDEVVEMMATGCLAVTNVSLWNRDFLKHGENALLTEPVASCIFETLALAVTDAELRRKVTANAIRDAERLPSRDALWEQMAAFALT